MKKINKNGSIGPLEIAIFVIIGVVAIAIAINTVDSTTKRTSVINDLFIVSNTTCIDVTSSGSECILSLGTFTNGTKTVGPGNFSLCDYTGQYARGYILNGSTDPGGTIYNGNVVNATYTQVGCGYVSNSVVQTIIPYIIILLVVLVFIGVAKWTGEQ